jgi:hypothetical protein
MSAISLRFGSPAHGWLEATITGPEGESTVDASDVPGDSLRMLADAASALLEGRDGEVTWFLEPAEVRWRFAVEGAVVRISVLEERRAQRIVGRRSATEVALAIWRGLRRLETDPAWREAGDGRVWSHAFPHRAVTMLGERLGRARRSG